MTHTMGRVLSLLAGHPLADRHHDELVRRQPPAYVQWTTAIACVMRVAYELGARDEAERIHASKLEHAAAVACEATAPLELGGVDCG